MSPLRRPRFDGRIYIQPTPDLAVRVSEEACTQQSTAHTIYFNLFCDASKNTTNSVEGGIAVTYPPWAPHQDSGGRAVVAAWPVNPVYDHRLGELLALSECLTVATFQIAEYDIWSGSGGSTIVIRIFNDNMFNIQFLDGTRRLDDGFVELASPVFDLIARQSWAIQNMSPGIQLELHWIPGHGHCVEPHILADEMARSARISQRSFVSLAGVDRFGSMEPSVVRFLKQDLVESASRAAKFMPELQGLFRHRNQAAARERQQAFVEPSSPLRMRCPPRNEIFEPTKQATERKDKSHDYDDRQAVSTMSQRVHSTSHTSIDKSDAVRSDTPKRRHHTKGGSRNAIQKPSRLASQRQRRNGSESSQRYRLRHPPTQTSSFGATLSTLTWQSLVIKERQERC